MTTVPARRALLITNDDGPLAAEVKEFIHSLETGGITLMRRAPARAKINDLVLSMRQQVDCVLLAGADNLLGAGAIALRDTRLPLGIFPLGAGHDLARRLEIPTDPAGAAAIVLAGHKRRLNLGTANGRPFFNVATVGLTIQDARRLSRAAYLPMGRIAYGWKAMRLMFRSARFAAIIRCGATVHRVHTIQITIGNGHLYEGGMAPGSERPGDDDVLGVYSLEPTSNWHFLTLVRAFTARAGDVVPEARVTRSPVVEIVTRLPRPITADGEIIAMTPARFSILSGAVDVFVPAPNLPNPPIPEPLYSSPA